MTLYHILLPPTITGEDDDELVPACGIELTKSVQIADERYYRHGIRGKNPPANCPGCIEVLRKLDEERTSTYKRRC